MATVGAALSEGDRYCHRNGREKCSFPLGVPAILQENSQQHASTRQKRATPFLWQEATALRNRSIQALDELNGVHKTTDTFPQTRMSLRQSLLRCLMNSRSWAWVWTQRHARQLSTTGCDMVSPAPTKSRTVQLTILRATARNSVDSKWQKKASTWNFAQESWSGHAALCLQDNAQK
jgi:hypothetical protein